MKLIIENESPKDAEEIVKLEEKLREHALVRSGRIKLTLLLPEGEKKKYVFR